MQVRTQRELRGRISLTLLAGLALGAWLLTAARSAALPTPGHAAGPGSVLAVHHDVLRALDSGDFAALAACFAPAAELLVVDEERGHPLRIPAARELGSAFSHVSTNGDSLGWKSSIVDSTTECPSGRLASGTIRFERQRTVAGKPHVRRYRSTALLRHVDGQLRIFYWHVSPDEPFTPLNELRGATR